jgi:rSAM/selenodomain-associated transferase 1
LLVYNLPVRDVIIFFAKAPDPGKVKTRLVPPLSWLEAAELHVAFVDDLLGRFQQLEHVDVELHTDVVTDAWRSHTVTRKLQISGCLGLKMFHALSGALTRGYRRAVVVGTDAPTLPSRYILSLLAARSEVALGPSDDGGFWGIAARETKPNMFANVRWSSAETLGQTVRAIEASGLSVELGERWFDIDVPADLARVLADPDLPPATRCWAERYSNSIAAL